MLDALGLFGHTGGYYEHTGLATATVRAKTYSPDRSRHRTRTTWRGAFLCLLAFEYVQ